MLCKPKPKSLLQVLSSVRSTSADDAHAIRSTSMPTFSPPARTSHNQLSPGELRDLTKQWRWGSGTGVTEGGVATSLGLVASPTKGPSNPLLKPSSHGSPSSVHTATPSMSPPPSVGTEPPFAPLPLPCSSGDSDAAAIAAAGPAEPRISHSLSLDDLCAYRAAGRLSRCG
jgi:hypothetical protein